MTKLYDNINDYKDLPEQIVDQIKHFFENYKTLDKGKWVKVSGWEGKKKAESLIVEGLDRINGKKAA